MLKRVKIFLVVSLVSGLIIFKTGISLGTPIVDISYMVTGPVSGIWTYSYAITVDSTSSEGIWCWDIYLAASACSITTPTNWNYFTNLPNNNWIEWSSSSSSADILPGNSLSGFSYQSYGTPDWVRYEVSGVNPITGMPTGNISSGHVLGATPEPSSLILLGSGLLVGIRILRKKFYCANIP